MCPRWRTCGFLSPCGYHRVTLHSRLVDTKLGHLDTQLSFNLLLWVNDNGKADARLIYEELAKEALLTLHTRTTDWRNDSAMLEQEVKKN